MVYHLENLPGGIVESCINIEELSGTWCRIRDISVTNDPPSHAGIMLEESFFRPVLCGSETNIDTVTMVLDVKCSFWKANFAIFNNEIRYYNDYRWTDTIRVAVKR